MKEWLIAHRGARCDGRENTLCAFKAAKKYPLAYVELDIHTTKDGIVVCHHDFDINNNKIATHTYKQLISQDPELTTFQEAIEAIGNDFPLMVHIKPDHTAKNVLSQIASHPRWSVGSFNIEALQYLRQKGIPKNHLFLFQHGEPMTQIGRALNVDVGGVGINHGYISPIWYWRANRHGLKTYTWTINSIFQARLFRLFYPHLAICTDRPDLLQKLS